MKKRCNLCRQPHNTGVSPLRRKCAPPVEMTTCRLPSLQSRGRLSVGSMASGLRCGQAVGGRRFVGAGVEGYLPLAVDLLPEGDVAAGGGDGFAVLGEGGGVVVSPGEAGVVGGSHLRTFGVPAELVLSRVPVGDGGDGGAAEDGGLAVVEGDAVVGEPGAEGFASAGADGFGELAFQLEQLEHAG